MSYGASAALQAAIYQRLTATAALDGVPVHDALPPGTAPETYVLIGPEEASDASDRTGGGAEHRFAVAVVSRAAGFADAKALAVAVSDALTGAELVLSRGRLVGLWFLKAKAQRLEGGALRRIDLTFRARVEV
ncbi:MAG: DUF3168 domain-containing protein [Gemmobacter sp.]